MQKLEVNVHTLPLEFGTNLDCLFIVGEKAKETLFLHIPKALDKSAEIQESPQPEAGKHFLKTNK